MLSTREFLQDRTDCCHLGFFVKSVQKRAYSSGTWPNCPHIDICTERFCSILGKWQRVMHPTWLKKSRMKFRNMMKDSKEGGYYVPFRKNPTSCEDTLLENTVAVVKDHWAEGQQGVLGSTKPVSIRTSEAKSTGQKVNFGQRLRDSTASPWLKTTLEPKSFKVSFAPC